MDFYRGDALNLRNRVSRVLPHWDASVPGYSYVLGMHAFGLEEMNQYPEAEATALRALALQPKDGWAVHAAVHVMEMQGRIDEGIAFLSSREADWAPDNAFAFHNFWHLALFCMDGARYERRARAVRSPRASRAGGVPPVARRCDGAPVAAAPRGVDVGDRFDARRRRLGGAARREAGFYAFNDVHAAMAFAMAGRDDATARACRAHGRGAARAGRQRGDDARGRPSARRGLAAFARGRYADAIAAIEPVRDTAHRFGGSHAQRDLLTLTLIEAAIRGGDSVACAALRGGAARAQAGERMGRAIVEARYALNYLA